MRNKQSKSHMTHNKIEIENAVEESEQDKKITSELNEIWNKIDEDDSKSERLKNVRSKKLIGYDYLTGLPINIIRHLIIPCVLGFLLYRNAVALLANASIAVTILSVVSCLFFTAVAVCFSFNLLKAQIAFESDITTESDRATQVSLRSVLTNVSPVGTPYFLKRTALILDLILGLIGPTIVFMVVYLLMSTGGVFATKIVYLLIPLVVLLALINKPVNKMKARAGEEVKRLG